MTPRGGSHEPEKPSALPAKAASADLATLVDHLVKLGLRIATRCWQDQEVVVVSERRLDAAMLSRGMKTMKRLRLR